MRLAKQLDFHPVFIIIPDRHQVDRELLQNKLSYYGLALSDVDIDLPNETLKEKLDAIYAPYVDVTSCLSEKFDQNSKTKFYYTLDNHLNALGHRAVAECLRETGSSLF